MRIASARGGMPRSRERRSAKAWGARRRLRDAARTPPPAGPRSQDGVGPYLAAEASATHFFVKLVLAAPASFFSAALASQLAVASLSHFFMKLVLAAPASFFSS